MMASAFDMTIVPMDENAPPIQVRTVLRDQQRYEITARKRKWGNQYENFNIWESFLAWSACERKGFTTTEYDQWLDTIESIHSTAVPIRPTPPVP